MKSIRATGERILIQIKYVRDWGNLVDNFIPCLALASKIAAAASPAIPLCLFSARV
jgi:hypothetical protein